MPPDGGISAAAITPDANPTSDPLEAARFTLELHGVPLGHMLSLLEITTGLQFHYAAPPDGLVYSSFHNAPLLPTLQEMLLRDYLWMQRQGADAYLLPVAATARPISVTAKTTGGKVGPPNAMPPAVAWRYWSGVRPPPRQWMFAHSATLSHGTPIGRERWLTAVVSVDAGHRPAFTVDRPDVAPAPSPAWLRWPLTLRNRPEHAQLLLETSATTTLYVNGAPLLRHWQGTRLIDLGQVLQVGENNLALYWPVAPPAVAGATVSGTPLLRYEWFIAGDPHGSSAAPRGNVVIAGSGSGRKPIRPAPGAGRVRRDGPSR